VSRTEITLQKCGRWLAENVGWRSKRR